LHRIVEFFAAAGNAQAPILTAPALTSPDSVAIGDRHSLRAGHGRFQDVTCIEDVNITASSDLQRCVGLSDEPSGSRPDLETANMSTSQHDSRPA